MTGFKKFLRWLGFEGIGERENNWVVALALVFAVVAVALRFFFWWYTRRIWEDALITVEHSENFVLGLGMTHYQPRLHGFTSPLSVLVPLIGDLMKVGFGISFIKIVSAFAAGLTVLYVAAIAMHPKIKLPAPLAALAMGYVAIEHHQILWGMSGMETQMVTLVLLMTFYYAIAEKPVALGLSLGLCMLARPDFAFVTMIVGAYVLITRPKSLPKVIAVAVVVYGPWIVFTTLYYGSPIPNTIYAKMGYTLWTRSPNLTWDTFWRGFLFRVSPSASGSIFQPLGPAFGGHGVGFRQLLHDHGFIVYSVLALNGVAAASAVAKKQWGWLPPVCFVMVYSVYYIFFVPLVFSWYIIPLAAVMVLLAARGLEGLADAVARISIRVSRGQTRGLKSAPRSMAFAAIAAAYLACFAVFLPKTFSTEKRIQEEIEQPVRESIGKYLGKVMGEHETVGCEPLGYIGYYSRHKVYDWPGLTNREVVEYSRAHPDGRNLMSMLDFFRPDFIALRYREYAASFDATWLDADYQIVDTFEVSPERTRDLFRIEDNIDTGFFLLARKDRPHPGLGRDLAQLGPNPKHSRAFYYLGRRAAKQNRDDEAIRDYEKAIELDPGFAEAYNTLGMMLVTAGRAEEGMHHLEKARQLDPKNVDIINSQGLALMQLGRVEEAAATFREAIAVDPDYPNAYNNLGAALFQQRQLDEAGANFEKALRLDPTYGDAYKNLGGVFASRGDFANAAKTIRKAMKVNPGDTALRQMLDTIEAQRAKQQAP